MELRKWLIVFFVVSLQLSITLSCLARRQDSSDYAFKKKRPIIDLVDEKDDGQTLTLGDSEKMIVPPEEDEDPSDDQAPDIDKNEDLEDLGRVQVVHLDNEVYDLDIQLEIFNQSIDHNSIIFIPGFDSRIKGNSAYHDRKIDIDDNGKSSHSKPPRSSSKTPEPPEEFPHIPEKTGLRLKSGIVRQSISKEARGLESQTANHMIIVIVIVLAFLLCLISIICLVFLIKIKLISRTKTCKTSKTSLLDNEKPRFV